ncbi:MULTISPECIES: hypothetical protein [Rhodomicrobium]|uniref:hypothetical protein n=1 Tax=Rhodomicrobium TaxID=1068 RepID=UPI000B4A924F|nr:MULTISPECIES: hypothetical protein [Rhodomicrobium]
MQLARFEQLVPEQQAEQSVPEQVLCVVDREAVAPHDARDTRFEIAAIDLVDDDLTACAQQRGAGARPASSNLRA